MVKVPPHRLSVRASHTCSSSEPVVPAIIAVVAPLGNVPREAVTRIGAAVAPFTVMISSVAPSAFTPSVTPGTAPSPALTAMSSGVVAGSPPSDEDEQPVASAAAQSRMNACRCMSCGLLVGPGSTRPLSGT